MTMEECIVMHNAKPMPVINKPNFLRYKFLYFKKNPIVFRDVNETHLDWKYWHSFSIGYLHQEVNTFEKTTGWYLREKKILIPKLVNNLLKFVFGKRLYSSAELMMSM